MTRRLIVTTLVVVGATFALELGEADAARRRGLFRRARVSRTTSYRRQSTTRSTPRSQPLHLTHSRSAILDGFFGPYPGAQGHDRSWYVGR